MRNYSATHNLTAISAENGEGGINSEAALDLSVLVDMGDIVKVTPRREDNSDEANGKEEADTIYDNGATTELSVNHNRAQPQHFAYLFAFALGKVATSAAGTGHKHTITPMQGGLDDQRELPSMTVMQRLGQTVVKRKFASMFVDSVSATFTTDDWVKVAGSMKGTGKYESNVVQEKISALGDATSLSIAGKVAGATASERLDAIHSVMAETADGVWKDVKVTAVSDAATSELTFLAPSASSSAIDYKILYAAEEGAGWTFPGRITESPLRVAEMSFNLGGMWDGSGFTGGKDIGADIKSISTSLSNNSSVSFVPGGGGAYASKHERGGRSQSLKVDRAFKDLVVQQYMAENATFGAYIKCVGAEYSPGHNYQVEIIFPKLGVLDAAISVSDKKLQESGDFAVLEDDTYGSVIVIVKNLFNGYAK